jgi:inosine-uridine nucleoside N-ribohydrolase
VVHDVLTVGEILDPGLLTCSQFRLTVDRGDGEGRGQTRVDSSGHPTVTAVGADIPRMRRLLERVFGPSRTEGANTGGHGWPRERSG